MFVTSALSTIAPRRRTAGAAPPPDGRIPRPERKALRRQGIEDGRLGIPEVSEAPEPMRTPMRELLLREYDQASARVFREYTEQTGPRWSNLESVRRRIEVIIGQIEQARTDLATAERRRPAPGSEPVRRLGDERRSPQLVAARRNRDFDREVSRERDALRRLEETERSLRTQNADLGAQIATLHRDAAARVAALRTEFAERQAIYNYALIRRHPEPDVLLALLEIGVPEEPGWIGAPAAPVVPREES